MSFINMLQFYHYERKSIRTLLSNFGVSRWSISTEPLVKLREEQVVALLLNWITTKLLTGETITLRIPEETTRDVYLVMIQRDKGCLHARKIQTCRDVNGQLLYHWPIEATINNITKTTIEESMRIASVINA